jgi:hypothetical protein
MICQPCRYNNHWGCPEARRQHRGTADIYEADALLEPLTETELAGSRWCDCQHRSRAEIAELPIPS